MKKEGNLEWFRTLRGRKHKATPLLIGVVAMVLIVGGLSVRYYKAHHPDISTILGQSAVSGAVRNPAAIAPKREPAAPETKAREPIASAEAAEPSPAPATPKAVQKKAKPPKAMGHPALGRTVNGEFRWQHFGEAPYANTRTEAMRTRERALRALGFPAPVVSELMRATEKPGERIRLVNGYHLSAMLSKGGVVHRHVVVEFAKPPVSGKMEYAAPAEAWQVTWQGRTYIAILPDVCNNWSRRDELIPAAPRVRSASECYEIAFPANSAYVDWGVATYRGPFPPDACNAQRQGSLEWVAWYGDCPDCVPLGYREQRVPVPHHYRYPVVGRQQVLRFSKEVLESVVYLCLGGNPCGVYVRPEDWKGRHRIDISPEMLSSRDCR